SKPNEKNILYQVLRLLRPNIQLVFVADGPLRPLNKNCGKAAHADSDKYTGLLRKTMDHHNVAWHKAPAEAEAECATLQKLGIVDCVWTEDADAFVFGAHTVLRVTTSTSPRLPRESQERLTQANTLQRPMRRASL
ncbi:PIN domain-like protein, partial [Leptodontidium sp. 2 PMI_412]